MQKNALSEPAPWFAIPPAVSPKGKVAVIGSGLSAGGVALALRARGYPVTTIERSTILSDAASGNPSGIVVPYISRKASIASDFYISSFKFALENLAHLNSISSEIDWRESGVVQLLSSERFRLLYEELPSRQLDASLISRDGENLIYPRGGYLDPRQLSSSLVKRNSDQVVLGKEINRIRQDGDKWEIFSSEESLGKFSVVVFTTGASITNIPEISWIPIEPVRGEAISVRGNQVSLKILRPVCYDGYITPAKDGVHFVGASYEHGVFSTEPNELVQRDLLGRLNRAVPNLELSPESIIGSRIAFRASTIDRLPYIGGVPDREFYLEEYSDLAKGFPSSRYKPGRYLNGLYVSIGHGSRGIISSLLGGELLGSLIDGSPLPVNGQILDSLNPARVIIKELSRQQSN